MTTSRAQNGDMQFLDGDGLPWGSGFYAWDRAFNVSPRAPCALRRNKNAACKSAAERCAGDCRPPTRRRQGLPCFPALHPERSLRKAGRRVRLPTTGGNFPQFPRRRAARDGAAQPPTGCRQFSETSNRRRGFSFGSPGFSGGEGETALFCVERKSFCMEPAGIYAIG